MLNVTFLAHLLAMLLDAPECLVADVVLHAAGILRGGLGAYAERDEQLGEHLVAFVDLLRDGAALLREGDASARVDDDAVLVLEAPERAADGRLRDVHLGGDIHRVNLRMRLCEDQNGFQIHFTGFVDHGSVNLQSEVCL